MALPPEPLDQLLESAAQILVAEVIEVQDLAPPPEQPSPRQPDAFAHPIGDGPLLVPQRVRLRTSTVLKGTPGEQEVSATKPEASYLLVEGVGGVFFLDASGAILGRRGPDEHSERRVRAALQPGGGAN